MSHGLSLRKRQKAYEEAHITRFIIKSSFLFALLAPFIYDLLSATIVLLLFLNAILLVYIYSTQPTEYKKKIPFDFEAASNAKCEIFQRDAIAWLREIETIPGFVITSLPDFGEMKMSVEKWKPWFADIATLVLEKLEDGSCAVFYQTDAKVRETDPKNKDKKIQTEWIDKSVIVFNAATKVPGVKLLWHRIMDRTEDQNLNLSKVGYSHLICFGKNVGMNMQKNDVPDVIDRGELLYKNSVGINACMMAALYCKQAGAKTVYDPFCGKGSFILAANYFGMDAVGIDINNQCCRQARQRIGQVTKGFAKKVQKYSFIDSS